MSDDPITYRQNCIGPKRFLLFAGFNYFPDGGWKDYRISFDELPEAVAAGDEWVSSWNSDWYQVVDFSIGSVVAERGT